jgi:hypothetical protein
VWRTGRKARRTAAGGRERCPETGRQGVESEREAWGEKTWCVFSLTFSHSVYSLFSPL